MPHHSPAGDPTTPPVAGSTAPAGTPSGSTAAASFRAGARWFTLFTLAGGLSDRTRGAFGRRRPWAIGGVVLGSASLVGIAFAQSPWGVGVACRRRGVLSAAMSPSSGSVTAAAE